MSKLENALKDALNYIYSPDSLTDIGLDLLQDMSNPDLAFDLADPSDPVVSTIEASALLAHAAVNHDWWCMTKVYPRLATTMTDLYRHMSDKQYVDLFDQPASTKMLLLINKEEIVKHAVPPQTNAMRRIVLPRESNIEVDGYRFTMQYPIEIRVLPSGGIRIVQSSSIKSPVRMLETNNIDWYEMNREVDGKPYTCIAIEIPVMQYAIRSFTTPVIQGTSFTQSLKYDDKFFFARVWMRNKKDWVELKVTHSQINVDLHDPTAVLTVDNGSLKVHIPDVYVRTGLVTGELRVDIYTTKGVIHTDFSSYNSDAFKLALKDLNGEVDSSLTAAFDRLTFKQVYSQFKVSGGRAALGFEELRRRVIDNSVGPRLIPISEDQLETTLNDMGYTVDRSIDYVSDLIFHASRELLASNVKDLTTPCGTTNGIIRTKVSELVKSPAVFDNGNRITIGPRTLFEDQFGTYIIHDKTVDDVLAMPAQMRVGYINQHRLFYSPFYYVMDTNSEIFETRPYDLDSPIISRKEFIDTNIGLELDIGIGDCELVRTPNGYRLRIITRSSDQVKSLADSQLEVQLCFKTRTSDSWSRLNGKLVGLFGKDKPERVYEFNIDTNMDLDKNHDLIVKNFNVNGNVIVDQAMRLECPWNVVFGVNGYTTPNYKPSDIDKVIHPGTDTTKGVTHEVLHVVLGDHLAKLWANCRSDTGGREYLTHDTDVYARYEKREYLKVDGVFVTEVGEDGNKHLVIKHEVGDIVYEEDGTTPVIQFAAGSAVLDNEGKPIVKNERTIIRRLELFLLDGRYSVCDSPAIKQYIKDVKDDLRKALLFDLEFIDRSKHSQTEIYIYPRNNMGKVWARYADNTKNLISSELRFLFDLSVDESTRTDPILTAKIKETIHTTIIEQLKDPTVSVSKMLESIRSKISDFIVDIEMESWGEKKDQKVYSLINPKDQLTMGKVAYVTPEGYVALRDDLRVSWGRLDEDLKK